MFKIQPKCNPACGRCDVFCRDCVYQTIEQAYHTIYEFVAGGGCGHPYTNGPNLELDQSDGAGMDVIVKDGKTEKVRFAVELAID